MSTSRSHQRRTEEQDVLWTDLDSAEPGSLQQPSTVLVFVGANARAGARTARKDREILRAYGRDSPANDSSWTALLRLAGESRLALVNTHFLPPRVARRIREAVLQVVSRTRNVWSTVLHSKFTASLFEMSLPTYKTQLPGHGPQHRVRHSATPWPTRTQKSSAHPEILSVNILLAESTHSSPRR